MSCGSTKMGKSLFLAAVRILEASLLTRSRAGSRVLELSVCAPPRRRRSGCTSQLCTLSSKPHQLKKRRPWPSRIDAEALSCASTLPHVPPTILDGILGHGAYAGSVLVFASCAWQPYGSKPRFNARIKPQLTATSVLTQSESSISRNSTLALTGCARGANCTPPPLGSAMATGRDACAGEICGCVRSRNLPKSSRSSAP